MERMGVQQAQALLPSLVRGRGVVVTRRGVEVGVLLTGRDMELWLELVEGGHVERIREMLGEAP